jgi:ABC-type spermidine/putrescine transport system, permease component II
MKKTNGVNKLIIAGILLYLFIPLAATLLFSIAGRWQTTVLPEYLTFKWYLQMFSDSRFLLSMLRSFAASAASVLLGLAVMIPAIFIITVYFPKLDKYLNIIVTTPFAIPGVVFAVGLIKFYSKGPLPIAGTVWILIGAYFVLIMPYLYQAIRNSLDTINVIVLMDAAEMLHASKPQAFFRVILPNILKGVIVATLLSFSILFGEFVLTNLLVGGHYETVQVYLFNKRAESGHFTSAVVITYFVVILILSIFVFKIENVFNKSTSVAGEEHL